MIGIYKITNPNNKIYIGQSINIEKRWNDYKKLNCKSQTKLYNSLKKYSWEQHKHEIIEECLENILLERETYWKQYYKVLEISSLCCRIDGRGGHLSEETIQKMLKPKYEGFGDKVSKSNKGISRNKNILKSKEHKIKLSKATNNRIYTSERLENMRIGMIGKNNKEIICINTNKVFNSIKEASLILNINPKVISNNLLGYTIKTKNNLTFKYK